MGRMKQEIITPPCPVIKRRFKDDHQNTCYKIWISISRELAERVANQRAKGNRDLAFKSGYIGYNGKQFPRNSMLYAIYVAGKEWKKINGDANCPDCNLGMKFTNELNTDRYGNLKYYWCKNCETEFISQRNGELQISANNR